MEIYTSTIQTIQPSDWNMPYTSPASADYDGWNIVETSKEIPSNAPRATETSISPTIPQKLKDILNSSGGYAVSTHYADSNGSRVITIYVGFSASSSSEAKTTAAEAAKSIVYNDDSKLPEYSIETESGVVIYKSDKNAANLEKNLKCPICFSKVKDFDGSGEQTWDHDPIKTPKALAGRKNQGFQRIKSSDVTSIQDKRKEQEINAGVTPETNISSINDTGYFLIKSDHFEELRTSTESILLESDIEKDIYFNYDEDLNFMDTHQEDWHDSTLEGNKRIRALHIEDLRHYLSTFDGLFEVCDISFNLRKLVFKDSLLSESKIIGNAGFIDLYTVSSATSKKFYFMFNSIQGLSKYNKLNNNFISYIDIVSDPTFYVHDIFVIEEIINDVKVEKLILTGKDPSGDNHSGIFKIQKRDLDGNIESYAGFPYDDKSGETFTSEEEITTYWGPSPCCDDDYCYMLYKKEFIKEASDGVFYRGTFEKLPSPRGEFIFNEPYGGPVRVGNIWYYGYEGDIAYEILYASSSGGVDYYYVPSNYSGWAGYWSLGPTTGGDGAGYSHDGVYYPIFAPRVILRKISLNDYSYEDIELMNTHTSSKGDVLSHFDSDTYSNISPERSSREIVSAVSSGNLYIIAEEEITSDEELDINIKNVTLFTFTTEGVPVARNRLIGNKSKILNQRNSTWALNYDDIGRLSSFSLHMHINKNKIIMQYGIYLDSGFQYDFFYLGFNPTTKYNIDDLIIYGDDEIKPLVIDRVQWDYQPIKRNYQKYCDLSYFNTSHPGYINSTLQDVPESIYWFKIYPYSSYNYGEDWMPSSVMWF